MTYKINNIKELERKYEELGAEIERLKAQEKEQIGYQNDPIFLLSVDEYKTYKDKIPYKTGWWWLRSPGHSKGFTTVVSNDNWISLYGSNINNKSNCVRPALNIKSLSPLQYKIVSNVAQDGVDRIIACGVTWVKIADDIYITENSIGFEEFDDISNDYGISHIRAWLIDWFEERKNW